MTSRRCKRILYYSIYIWTVSSCCLLCWTGLNWCRGRTWFWAEHHVLCYPFLPAQISQKEIKFTKILKCELRAYCPNIYCGTAKYQDYWAYVSCPSSAARRGDRAAVWRAWRVPAQLLSAAGACAARRQSRCRNRKLCERLSRLGSLTPDSFESR